MARVLTIDPGRGTGWVLYDTETRKWNGGCFLAKDYPYHAAFEVWLGGITPNVIVYEEFVYMVKNVDKGDEATAAYGIDLTAKEFIGIIKAYGQKNKSTCEVVARQPGQGFKLWTDAKLKKMGLYIKGTKNTNGAPHIRDATRHAVDHLVNKMGHMELMESLKPRR